MSAEVKQPPLGVMTASRLPPGAHLVLHGMRLWQAALIEKQCVFVMLNRNFQIRTALGPFDTSTSSCA